MRMNEKLCVFIDILKNAAFDRRLRRSRLRTELRFLMDGGRPTERARITAADEPSATYGGAASEGNCNAGSGWINVKDRLPTNEDGDRVIACVNGKNDECEYIAAIIQAEFCDGLFYDATNRNAQEITALVTHWRPFPDPPKEMYTLSLIFWAVEAICCIFRHIYERQKTNNLIETERLRREREESVGQDD